jgi:hypothetical protein
VISERQTLEKKIRDLGEERELEKISVLKKNVQIDD